MKYVVNVEEMRALEQNAIQRIGIPEEVLMERAAFAVWQELEKRSAPEDALLFLCGTGNNGGDGLAAARMAYLDGRKVSVAIVSKDGVGVFTLKERESLRKKEASERGGTVPEADGESFKPSVKDAERGESYTKCGKARADATQKEYLPARCSDGFAGQFAILREMCKFVGKDLDFREYTIVVDAIFGIGLSRPIAGTYQECIQKMQQEKHQRRLTVISVDVPSGIHADTGAVMGIAVEADVTVTFGWEKTGLLLYPGAQHAGQVVTAEIGIPSEASLLTETTVCRMEKADILSLPKRNPDTHKGDYGKVAVIAGSQGMCGAALLAAKAAYRAGAGIVTVVSAEGNRIPVQTALPEAIFAPRSRAEEMIARADCLAIGPGLGTDAEAENLVRMALTSGKPVVADADALNCISRSRKVEKAEGKEQDSLFRADSEENAIEKAAGGEKESGGFAENREHGDFYDFLHSQVIITPHVGEMARLTGLSAAQVRENPLKTAREFAAKYGCICVLKGARTVISDGKSLNFINISGNAGMAVGGSGDVLTGILAGLLATERDAGKAAALGVYAHGLAGDQAREKLGERSMTSADILDGISSALRG